MIVKIIARPTTAKKRSAAGRVSTYQRDLTRYILRADDQARARLLSIDQKSDGLAADGHGYAGQLVPYVSGAKEEEVVATFTRHLTQTDPDEIALEFEARLAAADLSNDYVHHFVLSWRDEDDTDGKIEQAAERFLACLGLQNCPAIIGQHSDTGHDHIHIAVVPVDAMSGREVPRYEYDKARTQMAAAVLCAEFDWLPELEARYSVRFDRLIRDDHDDLGSVSRPAEWPDHRPPPRLGLSSRSKLVEAETGRASAERLVLEVAPGILQECDDQDELHRRFREEGIALRRFGNGAAYFVQDERIKASVIRSWSARQIERKFGPLPKGIKAEGLPRLQTRTLTPDDKLADRYREARTVHLGRLRRIREGLRKVRLTGSNIADEFCDGLDLICSFPSLSDWSAGARPLDPVQAFMDAVPATAFAPRYRFRAYTEDERASLRVIGKRYRVHFQNIDVQYPSLCLDQGDSFLIVGAKVDHHIRRAMSELAQRGHGELVSIGLTVAQRKLADAHARELKIRVVHAKNEKEEAALLQEHMLRRERKARRLKAADAQRESRAPVEEIAPTAAAATRRNDLKHSPASWGETSRQADSSPPHVHMPIAEAATDNSNTPALLKLQAWMDAMKKKDPSADRLAYLVAVDESATKIAEQRLENEAFESLKAASSRHQHQLQMQQQAWGMSM